MMTDEDLVRLQPLGLLDDRLGGIALEHLRADRRSGRRSPETAHGILEERGSHVLLSSLFFHVSGGEREGGVGEEGQL